MDLSLYFWLEHKELFQSAYSDLLGGGAQESFLKMSLVIVFISAIIYSISETSNFIMSLFSFLSLSPAFQENVSSLPALKPLIQYSVVSTFYTLGLSLWLSSKESVCNARDAGDTVWSLDWEDPLEEGMYSCQENSMDRRAWWATVHRVAKSWTRLKWLSMHTILLFSFSPL